MHYIKLEETKKEGVGVVIRGGNKTHTMYDDNSINYLGININRLSKKHLEMFSPPQLVKETKHLC